LRWGAGIKGKVATSLAAGLPCVATAAAIVRIYLDDALWLCFSEAGIAAASRQFSFAANRQRMTELFLDIGIPAPASRSQPKGLGCAGIERISRLCRKYWSNLRRRASGCGFQFLVLAMLALFQAAVLLSWGIMSSA
jgi:hypothetical protein